MSGTESCGLEEQETLSSSSRDTFTLGPCTSELYFLSHLSRQVPGPSREREPWWCSAGPHVGYSSRGFASLLGLLMGVER